MSAYCASKAAVESLGDSLRIELRPSGARVGVAYYAELDTDMTSRGFATEAASRMPIGGQGRMPVAPVEDAIDALERGIARRSRRIVSPRWVGPLLPIRMLAQRVVETQTRRGFGKTMDIARAERPPLTTEQPGPRRVTRRGRVSPSPRSSSRRAAAAPAHAATTSQDERFTASDGVELATTLIGEAPLAPRPTIVEFSPYGRGTTTFTPGPAYNSLLVQIRGTGDSDGRFDALGPRTQRDVVEVLRWACHQPWSDGDLGINGFSASAITIYNSLHHRLPCVRAAVLKSGTFELYRDLLYPGGVNNMVPGAGVLALIGFPAAVQGLDRLARDPASGADIIAGLADAGPQRPPAPDAGLAGGAGAASAATSTTCRS